MEAYFGAELEAYFSAIGTESEAYFVAELKSYSVAIGAALKAYLAQFKSPVSRQIDGIVVSPK